MPPQRKENVTCAACGFENPPGMRFCGQCGAALPVRCPACGAANPPENRFCGGCGSALEPGESETLPPAAPDRPEAPPQERAPAAVALEDLIEILDEEPLAVTGAGSPPGGEQGAEQDAGAEGPPEVREDAAPEPLVCPVCEVTCAPGAVYCEVCGAVVASLGAPCPECGSLNPRGTLFCENCGRRLGFEE